MAATTSLFFVLIGITVGPYGLNLLSPSVQLVVDPLLVMALGLVGVFIGLAIEPRRPRLNTPAVLAVLAGLASIVLGNGQWTTHMLSALGVAVAVVLVALAGWLLIGEADSESEQQVFVVGSLMLVGGSAAYASFSVVFAGLLAGLLWTSRGSLAKTRIVRHLEYLQHPLIVIMLLVSGASITISREAFALFIVIAALHAAGRPLIEPFPLSSGLAAVAVALDLFRGIWR